jgi:hypothetical protein
MWLMIAGRYSAASATERAANFTIIQNAARAALDLGYVPVVGLNCGLPMVRPDGPLHAEAMTPAERTLVDDYTRRLITRCDGLWQLSRSPGADAEAELMQLQGGFVIHTLDELRALRGS